MTVGAGGLASSPSDQGTPACREALVTLIKVCELNSSHPFLSLVKVFIQL